jgi:hypothetical protein
MSMTKDGKVALVIFQYGGVNMDSFNTVKELVQHYVTRTSLCGSWGSQEQLDALRETKTLLDRTIVNVEAELVAELIRNG